jgi:hypothetical protein
LFGCVAHGGDAPALKLFSLPSLREVKAAAQIRPTNQLSAVSERKLSTNVVEEFSVGTSVSSEISVELYSHRYESMNRVPFMSTRARSGAAGVVGFLQKAVPSGGLLSKNPNVRRNPLEVDGW